jgi:outer membrane protein TolC
VERFPRVTVPLPFGASSAKKDAAASRVSSAYQNELAAKTEAQEKLASSKNAYVLALARERLREDLLSQAKIRHREVVLAFESRTATQLDVDRALLSVDEAAAALEDDKIARFKAVLDIYALCGIDPRQLFYPEVSSSQ